VAKEAFLIICTIFIKAKVALDMLLSAFAESIPGWLHQSRLGVGRDLEDWK
jgi:hypothetical protein